MNLEPVSVEHPRLVPSRPSAHGELKQKAALGLGRPGLFLPGLVVDTAGFNRDGPY